MPIDDSCCRFLNCDCKYFFPLKFQDEHICKGCGHDIDIHTSNANFYSNDSFSAPPSAHTPQYRNATTDSRPPPIFLGSLTPHHNNFLPGISGVTTETVARSATTNLNLIKLSQEFSPCDRRKKKTGK